MKTGIPKSHKKSKEKNCNLIIIGKLHDEAFPMTRERGAEM